MIVVWSTAPDRAVNRIVGGVFRDLGTPFRVVHKAEDLGGLEPTDVILAMGAQALAVLKDSGICPKQGAISSLREQRFEKKSAKSPQFIVTWDPGIVAREEKRRQEIHWDARLAWRLHETGSLKPKTGHYVWTNNLEELVLQIEGRYAQTQKPVAVSLDLETMGFYPYYQHKHILTSQWSLEIGRSQMVDHRRDDGSPCGKPTAELSPKMRAQLEWLLTSPKIKLRGTNLKGDLQWIRVKWGIYCSNFTFDTVLAGGLLNENRHNSLNAHTKEYAPELGGYDDAFSASYDKGCLEKVPRFDPEFTVYAGGDSDATLRCAEPIGRELFRDPKLCRFYQKLLHPASRAFESIELRGIHVDVKRYKKLRKEVKKAIRDTTTSAMKLIPMPLKAKYADNLSLTRPRLIVDYLFSKQGLGLKPEVWAPKAKWHVPGVFPKDKQPSTSLKDHLGRFRADPEAGQFIQALEDIGRAGKTLSTYILNDKGDKGFLTYLRPGDLFHPTYVLAKGALFDSEDDGGATTGRLSAKGPAWQTLPKHTVWAKKLRACFPAPPGSLCWQIDFSQGELRVFACLANERRMIAAYRKGMDLHSITAAMANHLDVAEFMSWKKGTPEQQALYKELRQGGKAGNFGLLYRMSAKGFQEYAWKSYGVVMTLDEAEAFRDAWHAAWPGVGKYHEDQVARAHRDLYVRTPLGRVRHLPMLKSPVNEVSNKAERQAINSPTQGTLSDLNLYAIVGLEEHWAGHEDEFSTRGSIHDSAHGYVRDDAHTLQRMQDAVGVVGQRMKAIRTEFEWDAQLDFPVDAELGPNLAELEELSLAA